MEEVASRSALGPPGTASPVPPSPPGSWPGPGARAALGPGAPRQHLMYWGEKPSPCARQGSCCFPGPCQPSLPAWLLSVPPAHLPSRTVVDLSDFPSPVCTAGLMVLQPPPMKSPQRLPASAAGGLPAAPHLVADRPIKPNQAPLSSADVHGLPWNPPLVSGGSEVASSSRDLGPRACVSRQGWCLRVSVKQSPECEVSRRLFTTVAQRLCTALWVPQTKSRFQGLAKFKASSEKLVEDSPWGGAGPEGPPRCRRRPGIPAVIFTKKQTRV